MAEQVEVVGMAEATRDLERWADLLLPYVDKATSDSLGDRLAQQVRGQVPVVTGALVGSVEVTEVDGEGWALGMGDGVPYAGWIEFGGGRGREYIAEGRYLTPTAMAAEQEYERAATDAAQDSIDKFHWSTPRP